MRTGKTTFFVANQANLEDMPAEKLAALEAQYKTMEEENKVLMTEVKAASAGERDSLQSMPSEIATEPPRKQSWRS